MNLGGVLRLVCSVYLHTLNFYLVLVVYHFGFGGSAFVFISPVPGHC